MPLRDRIRKTNRTGTIALVNMLLAEACLLTMLVARACDAANGAPLLVAAFVGLALITFPLGWVGQFVSAVLGGDLWHLAASIPLNAYFWGLIVELRAESRRFGLPPETPPACVDRQQ